MESQSHVKEPFVLAAAGDAIITRRLSPYAGRGGAFDEVVSAIRDADAAVANLEVLVHDYEGYPAATSGGTYMRAPPAVLDELATMGFDLFSAATNHSFDYSHGGIEATLDHLAERDLPAAGLGRNRFEAGSPVYRDTAGGRVGLVSACTSFPPGAEAGEQSPALGGRPGLNPIHVSTVHRIPPAELEALREISEVAGIEAVKRSWFERGLLYGHDWTQEEYFHFGDMKFETAEDGETGIVYAVDEEDERAFGERIDEAATNAEWVVATIHTHQGVDGLEKTSETPAFMRRLGRGAVEAGADVVVCHGPHVLRGIEFHRGRPIFHSLGNFIVQNESVTRLPPESFRRYGLEDVTRASDVFDARHYDDAGDPKGDLADERFWETVLPICTCSQEPGEDDVEIEVELVPCTLQRQAGRSRRGVPIAASGARAEGIIESLADLSRPFGTEVVFEDGVGRVVA